MSIRSGHGSATHDRVLRLLPHFTTELAATQFALREGLAWLAVRGLRAGLPIDLPVGSAVFAPAQPRSVSVSPRSSVGAMTSAIALRPVLPAERSRQIRHRRAAARTANTLRADCLQPA